MKLFKINGPPGTGKTTTICKLVQDLVKSNAADPLKIYALSFTNAAKDSLIKKFRHMNIEVPSNNIRTLHSFALQELKLNGIFYNGLLQEDIKSFFAKKGIAYSTYDSVNDDEVMFGPQETKLGNKLYHLFNLRRLKLGDNSWIYNYTYLLPPGVVPEWFNKLFREFYEYMETFEIYDFTRILEEYNRRNPQLEGDVLIVDEAQDLSPLQMRILEKMFPNFKYVLVAGDVDQSIFEWAGADPRLMLDLEADKKINLTQSYRLPEKVCKLAKTVIEKNKDREPIDYIPVDKEGRVERITDDYFKEVVHEILNNSDESIFILTRHKYLLHEYRKKLERMNISYEDVSNVGYSDARVYIGTIHKAKGLEADNVFLDLRVSKKVREHIRRKGKESERRVLYVGITRTKNRLFLLKENHIDAFYYKQFIQG